ncbi:hypothetical protein E1176_06975 [Fulvivirga sp. RKSG066]|uniref:DUF5683 domain-containing protein n=1 Tax=Fulvivirga aurantia TaxID=2529383 RepID=UPI0012BCFCFF|nr:DUF5683 domain-containing protein [Fulvivirga aurantia]MTI20758.1 hypothetical protein [Fulvivirga aurantia]
MKRFLTLGLFLSITSAVFGQITPSPARVDTTEVDNTPLVRERGENVEIEEIETYADKYIPRKASLYSAIFPGMGQVYNKSYWKLPIIYGGFIALGYTVDFYNDRYKLLRKDLFTLLEEGGSTTPLGFSESQVRNQVDKARRERDFYMIMTGVLYLLQIAEAHIDAHLKEFKLNPELRVSIEPMIERPEFTNAGYNTGLSLKFKF